MLCKERRRVTQDHHVDQCLEEGLDILEAKLLLNLTHRCNLFEVCASLNFRRRSCHLLQRLHL